jgi:hypothetical protein
MPIGRIATHRDYSYPSGLQLPIGSTRATSGVHQRPVGSTEKYGGYKGRLQFFENDGCRTLLKPPFSHSSVDSM